MRHLSLAVAVLALASPSLAQPASHPFFPLATGNVWVHDLYGDEAQGGGHRTTTVLGWTGEGDDAYWLVHVLYERFDVNVVSESECKLRIVTEDGMHFIDVVTIYGARCEGLKISVALPSNGHTSSEWISGTMQQLVMGTATQHLGGSDNNYVSWMLAQNVGLLRKHTTLVFGETGIREHLVYAEVNGLTIGVPPDWFFTEFDPLAYMPLSVGNEWVYHLESSGSHGAPTTSEYHSFLVTDFNNSTGEHIVRHQRFEGVKPYFTWHCNARMDISGRIIMSGHNNCQVATHPFPEMRFSFRMIGASRSELYPISNANYDLMTLSFFYETNDLEERYTISIKGAHGIGALEHRLFWWNHDYAAHFTRNVVLQYARIGDFEYGLNPVSSEALPSPRVSATLFPNPGTDTVHLQLDLPRPDNVSVGIIDLLGRQVLTENFGTVPGSAILNLDTSSLSAGAYFVRVDVGEGGLKFLRLTVVR